MISTPNSLHINKLWQGWSALVFSAWCTWDKNCPVIGGWLQDRVPQLSDLLIWNLASSGEMRSTGRLPLLGRYCSPWLWGEGALCSWLLLSGLDFLSHCVQDGESWWERERKLQFKCYCLLQFILRCSRFSWVNASSFAACPGDNFQIIFYFLKYFSLIILVLLESGPQRSSCPIPEVEFYSPFNLSVQNKR